ncbi:MAG: hypothetical protein DRQ55_05350 [Planctomycetota bacterium]|nr:MAG: hypothetical protein DRQ55_05350 [Planctomycetota bacterium]
MEHIDWNRLANARKLLTGMPDDESIAARYEMWRARLIRKDRLAEQQLDQELLDLLVQIQDAV